MAAFPEIAKIKFEGPKSRNPLAFRHYNANEVVEGKTMKDHLRFGVAYWHTFRGTGSDPFGPGTAVRPWEGPEDNVDNAQKRVRVAFEFIEKLGAPFYCFHDRDVAPEGKTLAETQQEPRRGRQGAQGRAAADRHQAAVGHGQPVQQPALHARRGHQPATPTSSPTPPPR